MLFTQVTLLALLALLGCIYCHFTMHMNYTHACSVATELAWHRHNIGTALPSPATCLSLCGSSRCCGFVITSWQTELCCRHDGKGNKRPLRAGELSQTSLVHGLYWNPLFSDWTAEPHPSLNTQRLPQLRLRRILPLPAFSALPHPARPLTELSDLFTPTEALRRLPVRTL